MPEFGPLAGVRAVGTGVLIAQPYIGTKLAEFGAEVIHIERAGGDPSARPRRCSRVARDPWRRRGRRRQEQAVDGRRPEAGPRP